MLLIFVYLLGTISAIDNQETSMTSDRQSVIAQYRAQMPEAERMSLRMEGSAEPIGSPGDWVSTDDYPSAALAEDRTGITAFRLQVNAKGEVSNCEISVSSGHSDLDNATCDLVSMRARFKPAMDNQGKAVPGTYSNKVRWQIPTEAIPVPVSGADRMEFTIETDGVVSDCKHTGSILRDIDFCGSAPTFVEPINRAGKATRKRVIYSSTTIVSDIPGSE